MSFISLSKVKIFLSFESEDNHEDNIKTSYLDKLIKLKDTNVIKIITGVRRSGKSQLMKDYIRYLEDNYKNINIIFIDFVDFEYDSLKDYHSLHAYVESKYKNDCLNYLFIDEVQLCPKFEVAINSLYAKGTYDIYITGSNAFLLSSDLATLFVGRFIEMHVYPFSYSEFLRYYELQNSNESFDKFLVEGGMPGSYLQSFISEKIYIQVSDDISNKETFEREYKPLFEIKDNYPKIIISRTNNPRYDRDGIKIIDIKDWLQSC